MANEIEKHRDTFGPLSNQKDPAPSGLPSGYDARKAVPLAAVLDYFPAALAAVASVIAAGQAQHGTTGWDRAKSTDESSTLLRHFMDRGKLDTDGIRHSAKVAWRALALLQKEIEAAENLPISRGSYDSAKQAREARVKERFDVSTGTTPDGRRTVDMVPKSWGARMAPVVAVDPFEPRLRAPLDSTTGRRFPTVVPQGTFGGPPRTRPANPGTPESVIDLMTALFGPPTSKPEDVIALMKSLGAPESEIARIEDVIANGCGDPSCTACKDKPRNAGVMPRGATRH